MQCIQHRIREKREIKKKTQRERRELYLFLDFFHLQPFTAMDLTKEVEEFQLLNCSLTRLRPLC
jgi:hypothetical protein